MKHSVKLSRFDGGLNTKVSPALGALNETPDAKNVVFDDFGAVGTRLGYEKYSSNDTGTEPYDKLLAYNMDSGQKHLLAMIDGDFYRLVHSATVMNKYVASCMTGGVPVQGMVHAGRAWFSNGYAPPFKYNGTEVTFWGVTAPASAPTVVSGAAGGNLNGAYDYTIIGVNSYAVKSNYSASASVAIVSGQANISDIYCYPSASTGPSYGVESKYLCRSTAGARAVYYIVTALSAAQTSYVDNIADTDLVEFAPTNNGTPPYFSCMVPFQGRVFGAPGKSTTVPSRLYYSTINEPEIFPDDQYLEVGQGDGYTIRGIGVLINGLIIAKGDDDGNGTLWQLYMPDAVATNWTLTKLDSDYGGQAPRVMTSFGQSMAYLNKYGLYSLAESSPGTVLADPISYNIESTIDGLANLDKSVAISYKNKLWISVPSGSAVNTQPNEVIQYDYLLGRVQTDRRGIWGLHDNMEWSDFALFDGELIGSPSDDKGYVYKLDSSHNDDGTAINSYFKTMHIQGTPGHENHTKLWRYFYITVDASGAWDLTITYSPDFNEETGQTETVDLDPGGVVWGTGVFGVDSWGGAITRKKVKVYFRNTVSKSIQLQFSTNAVGEYWKVHEVEIFYSLRGIREN